MGISARDQKMLWGAASGRCSFPKCEKELVSEPTADDPRVTLGEMAHIVGDSANGPRGESPMTQEERDCYENLILLCHEHHEKVDGQRKTYTVEVLHQYKREHEARCAAPFIAKSAATAHWKPVIETVHSTLLPVLQMPRYVYSAEAVIDDEIVLKSEFFEAHSRRPPAFIIRGHRLITFDDLSHDTGLFSRWVRPHTTTRHVAAEMWQDPDRFRWYVQLLNILLRKIVGPKGLRFDPEHHRFYFEAGPNGSEVEKTYTPMNRATSTRSVAWQPIVKKTGEKKKYWEHLAIGLRFERVSEKQWVLALRPERHFTFDGDKALTPKGKGRRSTSRAARLYNGQVLNDLQFWRSFLSEDKPRIVKKLGSQALIIDASLATTSVTWPGIEGDFVPFANQRAVDDLFTYSELLDVLDQDEHEPELMLSSSPREEAELDV